MEPIIISRVTKSMPPFTDQSATLESILTRAADFSRDASTAVESLQQALRDNLRDIDTTVNGLIKQEIPLELGKNILTPVKASFGNHAVPTKPSIRSAPNAPIISEPDELQKIDVSFPSAPDKPLVDFRFAQPPILQPTTTQFPAAPSDPSTQSVDPLYLDPIPVLAATEPGLGNSAAPTKFAKTTPVGPTLAKQAYPNAPDKDLPDKVRLRELVLPSAPMLLEPIFEGLIPASLDAPPNVSIDFTEQEYQSALSGALKDKLLSLVLNLRQTGLSPDVEQQVWDRARERTRAVSRGQLEKLSRMYMRNGWEMPAGDEIEAMHQAMEQAAEADITESRNIAIAQADLEQKNFQFAFTQALVLEGQLLGLHNNVQQRAFDAVRAAADAAISLFNAKVAYFNANVGLFTAHAQVYRDRIQAELAKVELYRGQLEGQKLIGELNAQDVSNYRAQIEAVVALFGLYRTELEAVKIRMEEDSLQLQRFDSDIRLFAEEIRAKGLDYEGYRAELDGERLKADFYNSVVNAFGKRIEAFSAVTDARAKKVDTDIKLTVDTPLNIAEQQTRLFSARVGAEAERLRSLNSIDDLRVRVFSALNEAETARLGAITSLHNAEVNTYSASVGAEAQRLGASIDVNRATIDLHKVKADIDTGLYSTAVQAYSAQTGAEANLFQADVGMYAAQSSNGKAVADIQLGSQALVLDKFKIDVDRHLATVQAALTNLVESGKMTTAGLDTISKIYAQLSASYVSALNLSFSQGMSISHGDSVSNSYSGSQSYSASDSRVTVTNK